MSKNSIESIFDYYIEYEFQTRLMDTTIKDKGQDWPKSILSLSHSNELKRIIGEKKINLAWKKISEAIKCDKGKINQLEDEAKEKLKDIFENKISAQDYMESLPFRYKNKKNEIIELVKGLKEKNEITICYPVLENEKVKKPFVTFNCILDEDKLAVLNYSVNRECLLVILAYIESCTLKEIESDPSERFNELYKKVNSIEHQGRMNEILEIINDEIFAVYNSEHIKSLKDFKSYGRWNKLHRVFITLEGLEELLPPIFREELQTCKDKYKSSKELPPLLEKYMLGNSSAANYVSMKEEFKFHYGSYTDKYPVNEKQWDIITAADRYEFLAVDGPPGTGKTTLLKELIADIIVKKAKSLIDVWNNEWIPVAKEVLKSPLGGQNRYSVVISSTNNMAVDNIGVELLREVPYFSSLVEIGTSGYKGMLCARLGKRDNVTSFYSDQFQYLMNSLSSIKDQELNEKAIETFNTLWDELEAIKYAVFEFIGERERFHKKLGVDKADPRILRKIKREILEASDQSQSRVKDEEINCEKFLLDIQTIEKELKNLDSDEQIVKNEIDKEEKNIKILYVNLEEYKSKSKYSLVKMLIQCISTKWKEFFEQYPSEEYIHDKIRKSDTKIEKMKSEIKEILKNKINLENRRGELTQEKSDTETEIENLKEQILKLQQILSFINSYEARYEALEKLLHLHDISCKNLYELVNCEKIVKLRKSLFDMSLEVMQSYIIKNRKQIMNNMDMVLKRHDDMLRWCGPFYSQQQNYSDNWNEAILALWETFFICFPVITTTLHSFKKEMLQIIPGLIDLLMIDEAGQILPHYLCAPLYRSRRAIIVGDVHQLEPIRLLTTNLISRSEVDEALHSKVCVEKNNAQDCADRNSDIFETEEDERTGMVLNEHRRCENSIMKFSNKNIYKEKLIVVKPDDNDKLFGSNLVAFDIRGIKGKYHYNRLEINACRNLVQAYKEKYGEGVVNDIAIISPFSKQVDELKKELPEVEIGTVHTFQGKEKDYVIFTTVIDDVRGKKSGLSDFIGLKGNLLNVAFSRAKKQFILVGNLEQIRQGSKFLKEALSTIEQSGRIYSFFDSRLSSDTLDEKELENWELASQILTAEDNSAGCPSSLLYRFIQGRCPKKIIVGSKVHYEILKGVIELASKSLYIFSPWISDYVVDADFLTLVAAAAKRNVQISICFGYKGKRVSLDSKESIEEALVVNRGFFKDIKATAAAIHLLKTELGVKLVYFPPIHTKLLLIDDSYMLIGSHNWLQNSGKSNDQYKEMSCLVTSPDSIAYVKNRYIDHFFENHVDTGFKPSA